jgi:hypothetical protein
MGIAKVYKSSDLGDQQGALVKLSAFNTRARLVLA